MHQKMLKRLTDEALERDEKRRAAVDEIRRCAWWCVQDYDHIAKRIVELDQALRNFGALTPAPQEKGEA